ncbi:hypothetical protein E2C01_074019 [Portunus trituberculatus]|uniref:Uncharacterized protein n=1 Tax=Portunus trituberculatus TaxID=210409 RepID=A0A5B7I2A5_PORTR|nr:hypothetical protein [Portunus trituberculatus]
MVPTLTRDATAIYRFVRLSARLSARRVHQREGRPQPLASLSETLGKRWPGKRSPQSLGKRLTTRVTSGERSGFVRSAASAQRGGGNQHIKGPSWLINLKAAAEFIITKRLICGPPSPSTPSICNSSNPPPLLFLSSSVSSSLPSSSYPRQTKFNGERFAWRREAVSGGRGSVCGGAQHG